VLSGDDALHACFGVRNTPKSLIDNEKLDNTQHFDVDAPLDEAHDLRFSFRDKGSNQHRQNDQAGDAEGQCPNCRGNFKTNKSTDEIYPIRSLISFETYHKTCYAGHQPYK